jgi:thiosulfate/3-mercaptopyruvate sulfurtransferase
MSAPTYAHPEVLVSADWVREHADDPKVRIVESSGDALLYPMAHIPGSVKIDWHNDLQDQTVRDYISDDAFEKLCRDNGISNDTTVVFYGDDNNWWACYAFWAFKLKGHEDCRILDGGRKYWVETLKNPTTADVPSYPATSYKVPADVDRKSLRVFRDQVLEHCNAGLPMVDVRSAKEYTGERTHMEGYPEEGVLRGGHIPGALHCPWARAVAEDGRFKPVEELKAIYESELKLKAGDDVVAYCRIGERSSLTWFVLKYLLGFEKVRNYDGSWTEWGNVVGTPIRKGAMP